MRATSSGWLVMVSPCSAKSSTMVNSRPYSAVGPMKGRKVSSYHWRPLARSPNVRVRNPARSGMPRKTRTDFAMAHMDTSRSVWSRPSQPGRTCR